MSKFIAIAVGDINGIGIELLIKKIENKSLKNIIFFTNLLIIKKYIKKINRKIELNIVNKSNKNDIFFKKKYLNIYNLKAKNNEENIIQSIKYGHKICKFNKKFKGLITLPIRKDLIIKKIDKRFVGQTEFLQKLDCKSVANMIFIYKKLIITPLTTHINLNKIKNNISKKNFIYNKILSLNYTLKNDFGINKPKILISGINPHAGENGLFGKEELKIIKPEISKAYKNKINVYGPISGDSMLTNENINKFDIFVFIYHDQALIPFKLLSQFSGVNFTSNLDIIRVSPDHGTAYKLVGKNKASDKSLLNCVNIINRIYKNRKKIANK